MNKMNAMKRKQVFYALLGGAVVAGVAFYFLRTKSGQKEVKQIKKTASDLADPFRLFGKEMATNVKQIRKEERKREMKEFLHAVVAGETV